MDVTLLFKLLFLRSLKRVSDIEYAEWGISENKMPVSSAISATLIISSNRLPAFSGSRPKTSRRLIYLILLSFLILKEFEVLQTSAHKTTPSLNIYLSAEQAEETILSLLLSLELLICSIKPPSPFPSEIEPFMCDSSR